MLGCLKTTTSPLLGSEKNILPLNGHREEKGQEYLEKPYANLLTNRKSPTSKFGFIEPVGIQKGWVTRTTNVEDIILGKRKVPRKWSQSTVKEELIKKGYWLEECHNCGYNEVNLATNKVCLGIDFKDGDSKNWLDGNIRLLCANCYYSFNGYFPSAKKFCK